MPLDQPIPTDRVESPKETNNSPLVSDLLINKQSETKEVRQNTLIRSNEELMKQNYLPKVAMDNPDKRSDLLTNNLSDKKDNPIRDYVNNTGLDTKTPARVDKNEKGEIVKIEPGQNYPSDGTSFEKRGDKWVELNLRFFSGREVNDVSMKANGDIVVTNHDESYDVRRPDGALIKYDKSGQPYELWSTRGDYARQADGSWQTRTDSTKLNFDPFTFVVVNERGDLTLSGLNGDSIIKNDYKSESSRRKIRQEDVNPDVNPNVNPNVKPGDNPEVKPGDNPEVKPGDNPEVKPGDNPEVKPGDNPNVKPGDDPEVKSGDDPNIKPGDNPNVKPGDNPNNSDENKTPEIFKGGGKGREFTVSEDGSLNYEVQKGDTLWSISKDVLKAKLNREPNSGEIFAQITEIASASGITNPNKIYPMDKIKVPQAKTNEADSAEIPKSITDQLSDTQKTDKPYLTNLAKMATVLTTKFNNFDANKDRQITPNEYQAVMDSYANLAGKETDPTKKKVMQTVHQVLEQAKVLFPRTASRTHAISPEYLAQSINDLTILSK